MNRRVSSPARLEIVGEEKDLIVSVLFLLKVKMINSQYNPAFDLFVFR